MCSQEKRHVTKKKEEKFLWEYEIIPAYPNKNIFLYLYGWVSGFRDRFTNMETQGKSIFGGLLTPNQEFWLVDWLEHSYKLVS